MVQYPLAGHVFVCLEGEHVVFLDVRKDRYFALEATQTAGLGSVVPGWPVADGRQDQGSAHSAVISLLLERGLLSESAVAGKDATPVAAVPPGDELTAEALEGAPTIDAQVIRRFVMAAATASAVLRFRRLERVLRRVSERNHAGEAQGSPNLLPFSRERALERVAAFTSLRPFFFTSKDACLFEALALSEFLARYRIFPKWVFGVQARPFAAHCWLQQGDVVLNDTVEHVSRYTPILLV